MSNSSVAGERPGELITRSPVGTGGRGFANIGKGCSILRGAGDVTKGLWKGRGVGEARTGVWTVLKVPVRASKTSCGAPMLPDPKWLSVSEARGALVTGGGGGGRVVGLGVGDGGGGGGGGLVGAVVVGLVIT